MRSIYILTIIVANVVTAIESPYLQGEYDPEKWPKVQLKLSQAGTLKDVFDSGLRPYRFPGLETSILEVKHFRLEPHLASGKILPQINAEWLNIKMFNDGEMSQIEGATPQLTLQEARAEMSKWLPYETRTERDLDIYLKAVETDPLDFDDSFRGSRDEFEIGWKEPEWGSRGGGPQFGVGFRKTLNQSQPLRLYFSFSWSSNRPLKYAKSYDIPIPPPPGYEHVSMKAPEKFGPDSGADITLAKGISIGQSGEASLAYEKAKQAATQRKEKWSPVGSSNLSDVIFGKKSVIAPWIIVCIVTLLVLARAFWLIVRKS